MNPMIFRDDLMYRNEKKFLELISQGHNTRSAKRKIKRDERRKKPVWIGKNL